MERAIAFTGCDLLAAPRAQARPTARGNARSKPAGRGPKLAVVGRRREVAVGGRRVKTIDVHAHCVIPEAYALLGLNVEDHRGPGIAEVGPRRIRTGSSRSRRWRFSSRTWRCNSSWTP